MYYLSHLSTYYLVCLYTYISIHTIIVGDVGVVVVVVVVVGVGGRGRAGISVCRSLGGAVVSGYTPGPTLAEHCPHSQ